MWKPLHFRILRFYLSVDSNPTPISRNSTHFSNLSGINRFLLAYMNAICQNNTMETCISREFRRLSNSFSPTLYTTRIISHLPKEFLFCFLYSFSCLFIPLPLFHTSIIPSKSLFSLFPPFLLFPQKILHFLPYSTKSFNLLQQTIHFYTSHSKVLPTRFSSLVLKPQLQPPIRWSINLFSPNYFFLLT